MVPPRGGSKEVSLGVSCMGGIRKSWSQCCKTLAPRTVEVLMLPGEFMCIDLAGCQWHLQSIEPILIADGDYS